MSAVEEQVAVEDASNAVEEPSAHFEPVHKLENAVETKTHEEDEAVLFKMYSPLYPLQTLQLMYYDDDRRAKLFRFIGESSEWKERGTGDVRLLQHNQTNKVRLVMRRDKTLKVCANHYSKSSHSILASINRVHLSPLFISHSRNGSLAQRWL